MSDVCVSEVEPDGVRFDPATVQARQTRPGEEYRGVEVKLRGFLENSRAPLKVDVAFGDVVVPGMVDLVYPVILDFPGPRLRAYTKESVIAVQGKTTGELPKWTPDTGWSQR